MQRTAQKAASSKTAQCTTTIPYITPSMAISSNVVLFLDYILTYINLNTTAPCFQIPHSYSPLFRILHKFKQHFQYVTAFV